VLLSQTAYHVNEQSWSCIEDVYANTW